MSNNSSNTMEPSSLLSLLKSIDAKKLETLKEEIDNSNDKSKHNDNSDNGSDNDSDNGSDNDSNNDNEDNDSDSDDSDKHIEMEVFTLEEIIQKMPLIFLAYEFYFENQHWYYANLWHTILGYLSILRIVILILGESILY